MYETQSSIVPMPGNAGSMLRWPRKVLEFRGEIIALGTDDRMWRCHRRQNGGEGYPIMYEMTPNMHNYDSFKDQLAKEGPNVTIQLMDEDDLGAPRQDLDLMPGGVLKGIVDYLIENKSYIKSEGDARALMTTMSKRELLDAYLTWNGIIGFTDTIVAAVEGVEKAKRGF